MAHKFASLLVAACLTLGPAAAGGFDGARAFADLREIVGFGPRVPGSDAAAKARSLIRERLRQAGWVVESQAVQRIAPGGEERPLENLWAVKPREGRPVIVVVTHFDSKELPSGAIPGANDGASGTALLLELARALPEGLPSAEVWLVFCDGSESVGPEITPSDGLYGSRAFVREIERRRLLKRISAVISVDLVADRDLRLSPGQPRSQRLANIASRVAAKIGDPDLIDVEFDSPVPGDHRAFTEKGLLDVLPLADFRYGSGVSHREIVFTASPMTSRRSLQCHSNDPERSPSRC